MLRILRSTRTTTHPPHTAQESVPGCALLLKPFPVTIMLFPLAFNSFPSWSGRYLNSLLSFPAIFFQPELLLNQFSSFGFRAAFTGSVEFGNDLSDLKLEVVPFFT
jgi:hypothetical protein